MRIRLFSIILILSSFSLWGAEYSDSHASISESLDDETSGLYAGLTAFELLLIPMGGKYESMGKANTAAIFDASSMEANPAATAILDTTELSFLHNNWIADSKIEGVLYTIRFDNLGIGLGGKFLYLPFTEFDEWAEKESQGYYSESVVTLNISYNFFSSYYFYGVSMGTNFKVAYRHVPESIYQDQSVLAAMLDAGLLTKFNLLKFYSARERNFSIGAAVKNIGFAAMDDPLPTEATAGIAYSPLRPLTIALDFTYPFTLYSSVPATDPYFAAGMDLNITDFFTVQGGFYVKELNPRISLGGTIDFTDITVVVNYVLDMTTQLEAPDRFSLEAKLRLGDEGRYALKMRVEELYIVGLEAYAKGNLRTAIRYWESVLNLDPGFQPAREMIRTSEDALALQEEMRNISTVE